MAAKAFTAHLSAIQGWTWFAGVGAALMMLGLALSTNLLAAPGRTTSIAGSAMLGGGVLMLLHALSERRWRLRVLWSTCGLLYAVAAGSILLHPSYAAILLAFWLVAVLAVSGLMRVATAFASRERGWPWVAASGLVSIGGAFAIAAGWMGEALWVSGLFLAIDLLGQGAMLMAVGLALRGAISA